MSFIYSFESGEHTLMMKRYETPIKMLIESESDNQRKKSTLLSQLFNVERSDRYGELVNIRSDFSTFAPAFEGDAAETDTTASAFTKVIEHIPFMKEFVITKQMIDDSGSGLAVDAKRRAQAFVRAYYLTMNKLAEKALRYLHRHASQVSPDSQGRIILSSALLEYAEINKDAVVVGCSDYCEIWSCDNYRAEIEGEDADEIRAELERLGL